MPDDLVSVRYVVNGVDAAIDFLLGGPASSAGRVSGNGVA
jgi:hypothetical protein